MVGQSLEQLYSFSKEEWLNNSNFLISFGENPIVDKIIKKVNDSEFVFSDKLDISNGFKPYQAGYGINKQNLPLTAKDVQNKIFHSNEKLSNQFKNEIKGRGVKKIFTKLGEKFYHVG